MGLFLEPPHILSGIAQYLGEEDIKVGEPEFDERFLVHGTCDEAIRAALTPTVCRLLVGLRDRTRYLEVDDERMEITVGYFLNDAARLDAALRALVEAATALRDTQVGHREIGPYRDR